MTSIIIIVVFTLLSAFFSACETAFSSVNRIRLRNYASQGDKRAEKALKIVGSFDKALTTTLIGNNVVNIASASLATIVFTEHFGAGSVGIATIVMTIVVLIFGEVLPKSLAKENAEGFTLFVSTLMSGIIFLFTPLSALIIALKNFVTKHFSNKNNNPSVTEEELMYIIDEIEDEGVLEEQESNLVKSALEFDEIEINEILIHRVNVVGIEISHSIEEIKDIFMSERYSRLPVYEKTIDSIVGIIHQKDFFNLYLNGGTELKPIIQKALYVSEHKKISEVLHIMQRTKNHMAIVLDQYGGTEGIVTLEDIIEELVGEIYDENDEEEKEFETLSENKYLASAELSISDLLDYLELPENSVDTDCNSIGGWVMQLLEHIPEKDEKVSWGIFKITVLDVEDQKIGKVLLEIEPEQLEEKGTSSYIK